MKLLIACLLILSFTIQCAFADTATNLNRGDPAPYPGVLLDKEKSDKIRDELIEKDALVKINESLNKTVILYRSNEDILSGQKKMLLDQNIELTKVLNDTRETSNWTKIGYFVLGMAVTSAAVYGATKLAK